METAQVNLTFKKFMWEEGHDWARGYLSGDHGNPIVNVQIDTRGGIRVEWDHNLPFHHQHFPRRLEKPTEDNYENRWQHGVDLATIKVSLEAQLKEHILRTYFDFA